MQILIFILVVQLYFNGIYAVSCEGEGSVQLVNGNNNATGRIEVCYNGQWGTVCGDFYNDIDSQSVGLVICKQLGFEGVLEVYHGGFFGYGTGNVWYLDCTGNEDSLADCSHNIDNYCWEEDIGIMCLNDQVECDEGAVQLVNGNSNATGRVEVCYNGVWGKLCDNDFELNDAYVLCIQLGFKGLQQIYHNTELFGEGPIGDFWFGNINCGGSENSIFDCYRWRYPNCDNTIDVGVACYNSTTLDECTDGSIQLVDGNNIMSGRIEVCYNGRWGTVCDDDFGYNDGLVACRQLGYQGVHSVLGWAYFGEGIGPIWLDELACVGHEESLFSCLHHSTHDCGHYEDVGVLCFGYASTSDSSASQTSTTTHINTSTLSRASTTNSFIQSATTIKTSSGASTINSIQSATTIKTTSRASTINSIQSATTIKTSASTVSIQSATPSHSSDPQTIRPSDNAATSDHLSTITIGSVIAVIVILLMMCSVITCFIGVYIVQLRKKNRRSGNLAAQSIPMDTMYTSSLPGGSHQQPAPMQQAFSTFQLNTPSRICTQPSPYELPLQSQYANKLNSEDMLKVQQFSAVHKLSPYHSIQQDHLECQKNLYVQNPAFGRQNVGPGKLGSDYDEYSYTQVIIPGENSVDHDVCGEYASVKYCSSSNGLDSQQKTRYKISESFMASLIPSIDLKLSEKLGQGEFGVVYKGLLSLKMTNNKIEVAIKTLKGNYTDSEINELIKEAEKMKRFDHPHVLSLIGICVGLLESPCIVMPFMSNGSLLLYLRKEALNLSVPADIADESQRLDVTKQLLSMCSQVAKGMAYLTEQFFIHRDLAARNCMISADGVIKVADFGLAEDVYTTDYFKLDTSSSESMKLPVKWMAVESLHYGKFNEKTDIWSFGVLCWEVFSVGAIPYPGLTAKEVIQTVDSGERLAKPSNSACRHQEYYLMLSCWESRPEDRPDFSCVTERINDLLTPLMSYKDFKFH